MNNDICKFIKTLKINGRLNLLNDIPLDIYSRLILK